MAYRGPPVRSCQGIRGPQRPNRGVEGRNRGKANSLSAGRNSAGFNLGGPLGRIASSRWRVSPCRVRRCRGHNVQWKAAGYPRRACVHGSDKDDLGSHEQPARRMPRSNGMPIEAHVPNERGPPSGAAAKAQSAERSRQPGETRMPGTRSQIGAMQPSGPSSPFVPCHRAHRHLGQPLTRLPL